MGTSIESVELLQLHPEFVNCDVHQTLRRKGRLIALKTFDRCDDVVVVSKPKDQNILVTILAPARR
jgi:hypothetical protein